MAKLENGATTLYHRDDQGNVIAETDATGALIAEYVYLGGMMLAKIDSAAGATYFSTTDPASTVLALRNGSRAIVWKADYKPFGEVQATSGTIENFWRFAGKQRDKETGLTYFGARYTRDSWGRFISPDAVGAVDGKTSAVNEGLLANPQKLNLYAYGLNNPYRFVDPDGNHPVAVAIAAVGLAVGYAFYGKALYNEIREPSPEHASAVRWSSLGLIPLGSGAVASVKAGVQYARGAVAAATYIPNFRYLGGTTADGMTCRTETTSAHDVPVTAVSFRVNRRLRCLFRWHSPLLCRGSSRAFVGPCARDYRADNGPSAPTRENHSS
jgi:RHS repeat-associated protein